MDRAPDPPAPGAPKAPSRSVERILRGLDAERGLPPGLEPEPIRRAAPRLSRGPSLAITLLLDAGLVAGLAAWIRSAGKAQRAATPATVSVTLAELEPVSQAPLPPRPEPPARESRGGTGTVDPRILHLARTSAPPELAFPETTPRELPVFHEPAVAAAPNLPSERGGDGRPRAPGGARASEGRFIGVPGGQALVVGQKDLPVYREVYPDYPPLARTAGIQGDVIVRFLLDEKGAPVDIRILEGPPQLHEASMKAARDWRFGGMSFRGRPVQAVFDLTFRFMIIPKGQS